RLLLLLLLHGRRSFFFASPREDWRFAALAVVNLSTP
ncbi:unnamed protein product, partial [Amoebophrya sp. A120]